MATALGLDAAELQAIGGLDESKLFLLQTAFRSIGNFFSLVSNPPETSPTAAARTLQSKFVALQHKQLQQQVGSRSAAPVDEGLGSSLPLMTTTSSLDTKKELESMRSGATGTREVSEFEAELARNLVLVQDKLLRTTMRLDVMEMVQVLVLVLYCIKCLLISISYNL